jgi:hypothetical protein
MRSGRSETSRVLVILTIPTIFSVGLVRAQQSPMLAISAGTGSVIGCIVHDETKLPTRFAEIHLVPKPADAELVLPKDPPTVSATSSTQHESHLSLATGSIGMDGSFRVAGVPAGDYFVVAIKPGYVTPVP